MRKIYSGRSGGNHIGSFEFIVNTAISGSSGVNYFRLPLAAAENGMSFLAEWGDGTSSYIDTTNFVAERLHDYGAAGNYTVKLSGNVVGFSFGDMSTGTDDASKLIEIVHWGDYKGTEDRVFTDCINLTHVSAKDTPLLIVNNTTQNMFSGCTNLVAINNLNNWNVRIIEPVASGTQTALYGMFNGCAAFESGSWPTLSQPNLSNWDVSQCADFRFMFAFATSFNGELFRVTQVLNGGIGQQGLENMFYDARSFNNGGSSSINNWDVSSAGSFQHLFLGADAFNQPLNNWDTSSVTDMRKVFFNSFASPGGSFNQPLNNWDVSNVTDMRSIFGYSNFDQDISSWNVNALSLNGNGQGSPITGTSGNLTLSTTNYDALLIAWDAYSYPSWPGSGMNFGNSTFSLGTAAETARTSLIAKWGGITDGGGV